MAAMYANRSAAIRAASHSTFATSGSNCTLSSGGKPPSNPSPPPPSGPPTAVETCVKRWEKDTKLHHHGSNGVATLNCGPGKVISAVTFADYGTCSGDCQQRNFSADASCSSSAKSTAIVESLCLHKQWCRMQASDHEFDDSCRGVTK